MYSNIKLDNKRIIASIVIYIIWIIFSSVYSYYDKKEELMQRIDTQLMSSALVIPVLLGDHFHHQNMSKYSVSQKTDMDNIIRLSQFSNHSKLSYVYSLIRKNQKILFSSSSATEVEIRTKENLSTYFSEYEDAPLEVGLSFESGNIQFAEYSDKWGHFRSVFIPKISADGVIYICAADIDINYIQSILRNAVIETVMFSISFLLFITPLVFVLYRQLFKVNKSLREVVKQLKTYESELKQKVEDINSAKQEAEQANEAKSKFLANISHELRTPMHGILSFSQFGIRKSDTESRKKLHKYFFRINTSGNRLLQLLNNLLDLSKFEAGKMIIKKCENNFSLVFDQCYAEQEQRIKDLSLNFTVTQCSDSVMGYFDEVTITQVISNLLSNAIKFSPKGGEINVTINKNRGDLLFSIMDQGKGVPEQDIESIFDTFIQSSVTDSGLGGTGLGLAICKEIMSAHDGKIWVENNAITGAIFKIILPRKTD